MRGKMSLSKALKHGGIQQANKSKNAFFFFEQPNQKIHTTHKKTNEL